MQKAMGVEAFYAMEFLSERFDKMSSVDQIKVIIHELMHIPNTFGGGFRHHDHVTDGNVNKMYEKYINEIKRINQDDPLGLEFLKIQQKENELFTKKIKKPTRKGFFWR